MVRAGERDSPATDPDPSDFQGDTTMRKSAALIAAAMLLAAGAVCASTTIPHPIDSYPPITAEQNACLMCHKVAAGEKRNRGQIPVSHATNGKVNGDRWACTICHAPSISPEAKLKTN